MHALLHAKGRFDDVAPLFCLMLLKLVFEEGGWSRLAKRSDKIKFDHIIIPFIRCPWRGIRVPPACGEVVEELAVLGGMNFKSGAPPYPIAIDCFRPFGAEAICAMFCSPPFTAASKTAQICYFRIFYSEIILRTVLVRFVQRSLPWRLLR